MAEIHKTAPLWSHFPSCTIVPVLKKEGGTFDLAIALGILAASHQLEPAVLSQTVCLGELALDGKIRSIPGILPMALAAGKTLPSRLLLPLANADEARWVDGLELVPLESLHNAVEILSGKQETLPRRSLRKETLARLNRYDVDFADVKGQAHVKRALEVAVCGGHHVLMIGPPGSGKTMLTQRIPTIQPELSLDEALEVTQIHSIAGLLNGTPIV